MDINKIIEDNMKEIDRMIQECDKEQENKTSEADKMFEELEYKKVEDRYNIDFNKIYNFTNGDKIKEQIRFCKLDKYVHLECYNYNTGTTFGKFLDMQELKAIYLKCKELGWI